MEQGDLYVRIGPRRRRTGKVAVGVRLFPVGAPAYDEQLEVRFGELADLTLPGSTDAFELARTIADVVSRGGMASPPWRLLLEIDATDLYAADWERILTQAPSFQWVQVVRFRNVSDEHALLPFELPARVLEVSHTFSAAASPSDGSMRYFRHTRANNLGAGDLAAALRTGRYEIVQIDADARRLDAAPGELSVEGPAATERAWMDAAALKRGLAACKARVLILQCRTPACYAPLLDLAHRLLRLGGPTTFVVDGLASPMLDGFYMSVVHDQPLSRHYLGASEPTPPRIAMLAKVGGERVLSISPMANRLTRAIQRSVSTLDTLFTRTAFGTRPRSLGFSDRPAAPDPFATIETAALAQRDLAQRNYNFTRESGAWVPLPEDTRAHARNAPEVDRLKRGVSRVVNLGLHEGDRALRADEVLRPGEEYELSLQIGRRAAWSVIDGDAAFPEQALDRHYVDNGVELRVVVFAPGFEIDEPDQRLRLERPPAESAELRFGLRTPLQAGRQRVRVCIYHRQNLLQSILMRVVVQEPQARRPREPGITAEVEFALSMSLDDFERLPGRTVNLLTNATDTGSHTLAIVGGGSLRTAFDLGENEMRSAVKAARQALLDIAADTGADPPKYRFDDQNRTSIERLTQDAIQLAQLGWLLYRNIVTGKDRKFEKDLRAALGPNEATLQVAAVKSARYVFPWAVVYDHPLVVGPTTLCPDFATALRSGQPLAQQKCLVSGCAQFGKTNVVCPSGFWGFKHLIEQPLSSSEDGVAGDLVLEINGGPAGSEMPALMVVSRELRQVTLHEKELRLANSFSFQMRDTKTDLGESMQSIPLDTNLYYFYCHGGRSKDRTWLGIGAKEQLVASDLGAWQIDWSDKHPLVFINGCHTVDLTPDDLLSFNQEFAFCQAAGVIGTEISIPEGLARAFASGFMPRFAAGATVGDALRQQRLALLQGCNLLGLVYTPYCSTNLKVVRH